MAVDIGTLRGLLVLDDKFSAKLDIASSKLDATGKKWTQIGGQLNAVGSQLTKTVTLPLLLIGGAAIKAASDFESSFAGVEKTVTATEPQLQKLAQGFRDMAKEIPVNVNEINRIGEAAGQLGIKTENILDFTRVMADLGVATNLSADQAATSLARLANITGLPQTQFDRLGATIVELGNNLATTESEILDFGLRIAGAGKIAGLTEAQILSIGGAMSSVGIEAAAGGTAVQKVLLGMTEAAAVGGEKLDAFAAAAGMSAQQFADAFEKDAAGAFTAFVENLGAAGDDAFQILADLGLEDERLKRAFLSLAGAGDLLRDAIDAGTTAFEENKALAEEVAKRYETFASQLTIFKNNAQDVFITLGTALLPILQDLLEIATPIIQKLGEFATFFANLPKPIRTAALAIAAIAAAIGPVLIIVGSLITAGGAVATALAPAILALGATGFGGAIAAVATGILGPVGAVVAVGALSVAIGSYVNEQLIGTQALADFGVWLGIAEPAVKLTAAELETMAMRTNEVAEAAVVAAPAIEEIATRSDEAAKAARLLREEQEKLATALTNLGVVTKDQAAAAFDELKLALEKGNLPAKIAAGLIDDLFQELDDVGQLTPELEAKILELARTHDRLGISATSAIAGISSLGRALAESTIKFRDANVAAAEFAELTLPKIVPPLDRAKLGMKQFGITIPDVGTKMANLTAVITAGDAPVRQLVMAVRTQRDEYERLGVLTPEVDKKLRALEKTALENATAADRAAIGFKSLFDELKTGIPVVDSILGKFQGFLGIFGKVANKLGGLGEKFGDFGSKVKDFMEGAGGKAAIAFGGAFGQAFQSGDSGIEAGIKGAVSAGLNLIPVVGPLLSQLAGPIVDLFQGVFRSVEDIRSQRQGGIFGAFNVPKQVLDSLGKLSAGISKAGRSLPDTIASLVGFKDVIRAVGISDMPQFMFAMNKGDEAVKRLKEGVITAGEAAGFFGADSLLVMRDAAIELGDTATTEFQLMIDKALAAGIIIPAEFQKMSKSAEQLAEDAKGMAAAVSAATSKISSGVSAALAAGINTIGQAKLAASGIAGVFKVMSAEGKPMTDILAAIGSQAKDLVSKFIELGEKPPAALAKLNQLTNLLANDGIENAISRTSALGDVFSGLSDLGLATNKDLAMFAVSVKQAFDEVVAGGGSAKQAIALIGPELQSILNAQAEFGFSVDAGTQKLLNQALAQGVVKTAALSTTDAITQGFTGLFDRFDALLKAQGVATEGFLRFGAVGVAAADVVIAANDDVVAAVRTNAQQTTKIVAAAAADDFKIAIQLRDDKIAAQQVVLQNAQLSNSTMIADATMASDTISRTLTAGLRMVEEQLVAVSNTGAAAFGSIADAADIASRDAVERFERMRNELVGQSIITDTVDKANKQILTIGDAAEEAARNAELAFGGRNTTSRGFMGDAGGGPQANFAGFGGASRSQPRFTDGARSSGGGGRNVDVIQFVVDGVVLTEIVLRNQSRVLANKGLGRG